MSRLGNFNQTPPIAYPQVSKDVVLSPSSGACLAIGEVILTNRAGSAINVGFGWKLPNSMWQAGQLVVANTPDYVEDTVDAQDAGAGDFAVTTTAAADDGMLVQADVPFNIVGMTVSQAQAGSPVYTYEYYNGTAYATLPTYAVPASYTVADHVIAFPKPHDWVVGTHADQGGSTSRYSFKLVATTSPSTAVLATVLWVGQLVDFYPSLANNSALNFEMKTEVVIPAGAGLLPYFGTANSGNTIQVHYREIGKIS